MPSMPHRELTVLVAARSRAETSAFKMLAASPMRGAGAVIQFVAQRSSDRSPRYSQVLTGAR